MFVRCYKKCCKIGHSGIVVTFIEKGFVTLCFLGIQSIRLCIMLNVMQVLKIRRWMFWTHISYISVWYRISYLHIYLVTCFSMLVYSVLFGRHDNAQPLHFRWTESLFLGRRHLKDLFLLTTFIHLPITQNEFTQNFIYYDYLSTKTHFEYILRNLRSIDIDQICIVR